MGFGIPNLATAAFGPQSEPDQEDFLALVAGLGPLGPTGVQSGCAVTAQGSPNMTVAVAAGFTRVGGRLATVSAGNVTITTADATNPRFDLIVVSNAGVKSAVAGTAAPSPVFPAIPAVSAVLASVYVPATDTAINTNQIIDKRVLIADPGYEDVKWYGALGDGATNDGPSIQACFDAVPTNGRLVRVPDGDYLTLQELTPKTSTVIKGTHATRYINSANPTSSCKIRVGTGFVGTGVIQLNVAAGYSVRGVSIYNLCIAGDEKLNASSGVIHGVRFPDIANVGGEQSWKLVDCQISGMSGSGIYGRCWVVQITNCFVNACLRYGTETANGSTDRWNDCKVFGSYFFFNRMGGMFFDGGMSSLVTVAMCRLERSGQIFGNPDNNPTEGAWNANAAGLRVVKGQYFLIALTDTDANTGPGFDFDGNYSGSSATNNNHTLVCCKANRDGGGDQTANPAYSAGFRITGFNSTDGNVPKSIQMNACRTGTGKSDDAGGGSLVSPAYGVQIKDAFFVDWVFGEPVGLTNSWNITGEVYGSALLYNDAGRVKLLNRAVTTTEGAMIAVGLTELAFWTTDATAAVAAQGLDLPSALTELDVNVLGTRHILETGELGSQFQLMVNARSVTQSGGTNTVIVSIRDTSNTANVLCTATVSQAAASTTYVVKGSWTNRPSWLTGDKTLAVYTSGGDGADDLIFKNIKLLTRTGGT